MKIPFVASAACWRKTVELEPEVFVVGGADDEEDCLAEGFGDGAGSGSCRTSIGIASRWQAKMAFMMGMYW